MKDPIEGFNNMSESEKEEAERILLDTAFRNSYQIITGKSSFENIIEETGSFLIAHNPESDLDKDDLINMMSYFTETEEYEKCGKIRDKIKEIKDVEVHHKPIEGIDKIFNKFVRRTKKDK